MPKMLKTAIAALIAAAALSPVPAAADGLDRTIMEIGRATGVVPYGCRYGSTVDQVTCYTHRAENRIRKIETDRADNDRRRMERVRQVVSARKSLDIACQEGDRWSCNRASTLRQQVPERSLRIMQALAASCRAGDRPSCDRLRN